ncbi:MAG: ATP-binding protein [Bacteroidaceae bacterium]|nr:ATP-binding protein [Bacteroidaceae bacterium]
MKRFQNFRRKPLRFKTSLAIRYTKQQPDVRFKRSITLSNDVQEVPQLAQFVEEVCEAVEFDPATTMSMNLAIEEAVVNVMNYAYPAGTKGDIDIEAQANDVRLKFTIIDSGTPFDPTAKEEVDTTLTAEERSIGGLGIHLVRQLMDSINYERVGGKNILTLRKKIQQ